LSTAATGSVLGGATIPWQVQVKFLGSYMLPYEVLVAAAYQTFAGVQRTANVTFPGAVVAPALGRPLSLTTCVLVNVIQPGTVFAERLHEIEPCQTRRRVRWTLLRRSESSLPAFHLLLDRRSGFDTAQTATVC